jgi:tRNA A-37 threonylcarbamoyl transferase component Bud32
MTSEKEGLRSHGHYLCQSCGKAFQDEEGLTNHSAQKVADARNGGSFGLQKCVVDMLADIEQDKRADSIDGHEDMVESARRKADLAPGIRISKVGQSEETAWGDCESGEPIIIKKAKGTNHDHESVTFESYSANLPKAGFPASGNDQSSPISSFASQHRSHVDFASPRSYKTAQSSLASYATASSLPRRSNRWVETRSAVGAQPSGMPEKGDVLDETQPILGSESVFPSGKRFRTVIDNVAYIIWWTPPNTLHVYQDRFHKRLGDDLMWYPGSNEATPLDVFNENNAELDTKTVDMLFSRFKTNLERSREAHRQDDEKNIRTQTAATMTQSLQGTLSQPCLVSDPVFSSDWLKHLSDRGILPDPQEELDWSGRGQHVEYEAKEEPDIPLRMKKVLGHSMSAIVESVQCRRILLARKTVKCDRRLTKEMVITEVEHLQRLQHAHIVRFVGSYTLRKTLSLLLYPSADQNLEEFMDDNTEREPKDTRHAVHIMPTFFGCLSTAMSFIHSKNVKHMDIKPKNILIRQRQGSYQVYVADFGIAKAYESAAESFTDSPTSFTRTYAAPEVVMQDTRGFPADVFSLGCVFMEMLACITSNPILDQRERLFQIRGAEYNNHIDEVLAWHHEVLDTPGYRATQLTVNQLYMLVPQMLSKEPSDRPLAGELKTSTIDLRCSDCDNGPEPFEAAKPTAFA